MNKEFTISVIVPLYNKDYGINRCIDSIVRQTKQPNEVIIINDGSTDNSLMMAENAVGALKCKHLIISQKNLGVSLARNHGVRLSQSRYVAFLDADDEWLPCFIESAEALVADFTGAALYTFGHYISEKESSLYISKSGLRKGFRGPIENYLHAATHGSIANSSKVVICKKIFESSGGFPANVKAGEDLFLWIKLASMGNVVFDSIPSAIIHRRRDDSRIARRGEVPFPLQFYSRQENMINISFYLKKYLWFIARNHILGSLAESRTSEAWERVKYSYILFPFKTISLIPLFILPPRLFSLAKILKNKLFIFKKI